ncbi:MAG: glycerol dehydratase reactivase beta/small subunit family protein [Clostridia bacterium]|nr:glycerol dehydratase reactivase beta/small subunit family protein [Clostridia bacterium]
MIVTRPAVRIYTYEPDLETLSFICEGIEEEGVLYEVIPHTGGEIAAMALQAAEDSILGSGIALYRKEAVLQLKGLPKNHPVADIWADTKEKARMIGANSARLIQKRPLKEI